MALADLVPGAGALEIADAPVRVPVLPKGIVRIVRGGEILRAMMPYAAEMRKLTIKRMEKRRGTGFFVRRRVTEGDDSGVFPSG